MIIDVYGDALRLSDHFVYYATRKHSHRFADATWYDTWGFQRRAEHLEKLVDEARAADPDRRRCCDHCGHVV